MKKFLFRLFLSIPIEWSWNNFRTFFCSEKLDFPSIGIFSIRSIHVDSHAICEWFDCIYLLFIRTRRRKSIFDDRSSNEEVEGESLDEKLVHDSSIPDVYSKSEQNLLVSCLDLQEYVESSDTYWFASKRYEFAGFFRLQDCSIRRVCLRLGTRFRPLSLEIPKPLFPIAGFPILYHLIESCAQVTRKFSFDFRSLHRVMSHSVTWITRNSPHWMLSTKWSSLSFYRQCSTNIQYLHSVINPSIMIFSYDDFLSFYSYLQEYASLGTGGGIYHFRDLIKSNVSDKDAFFVINGDICADLPLVEMLQFHRDHVGEKGYTILTTEVCCLDVSSLHHRGSFRQRKNNRRIMVVLHGIKRHMKWNIMWKNHRHSCQQRSIVACIFSPN